MAVNGPEKRPVTLDVTSTTKKGSWLTQTSTVLQEPLPSHAPSSDFNNPLPSNKVPLGYIMSEDFPGSAYPTDLVPDTNPNTVSNVSVSLECLNEY